MQEPETRIRRYQGQTILYADAGEFEEIETIWGIWNWKQQTCTGIYMSVIYIIQHLIIDFKHIYWLNQF